MEVDWIRLNEESPPEYKNVFFCCNDDYRFTGYIRHINNQIVVFDSDGQKYDNVMYWMPIPKAPKDSRKEK